MTRYRFRAEYHGGAFHGWQIQNGQKNFTVQAELERAFGIALGTPIQIVGSGRTDTGVHARGQVAHFDWDGPPPDLKRLELSVNGLAHHAVRVRDLEEAPADFHARYSAVERYYQYTLYTRPVALGRDTGWDISRYRPDLALMAEEAQHFLGTHDFAAFSIPRHDGKSTLCTITEFRLEIHPRPDDYKVTWHIRGNRFLHRQVRSMVGLLCDVGRGRHPPGTVPRIFANAFRGERTWAPPHGLCLVDVIYRSAE